MTVVIGIWAVLSVVGLFCFAEAIRNAHTVDSREPFLRGEYPNPIEG